MLDTVLTAIGDLAAVLGTGPALIVIVVLLVPVPATTLVLTWHGLRGTNPGPAAAQLLKLIELLLARRRRRTR